MGYNTFLVADMTYVDVGVTKELKNNIVFLMWG